MAKRRKKSPRVGLFILLFIVVAGAAGLAYYTATKQKPVINKPANIPSRPTVTIVPEPREVVIYLPVAANNRFYLKQVTRTTDMKGDILDVAARTLLATTSEKGEAGALIPKGTKLLSAVKVTEHVAVVNLSKEFLENFSGGSTQEALTLNSIAHTLVDNSGGDVQKVQILVEGKTAETLGGHFELADPIAADSTLLTPGSSD